MTVLIAGGGIAGLSLALTCHQLGMPFKVFESVPRIEPLGVGINLQPGAVRELMALGLSSLLERIGVQTVDYGMYSKYGRHIWTEPRGLAAGYHWPQYSVHRGELHLGLYNELVRRAGADCVRCGRIATGFDSRSTHVLLHLRSRIGETHVERGDVLIGADGIHSAIRKQIVPGEPEPRWGGAVLWRGTSVARPFLSGASMVMMGHSGRRFVAYPISRPDPLTGLATINWIANLNYDPARAWHKEDWSRLARLDDFLPEFLSMQFNWLDVPGLIRSAQTVYEYPMVDRDPLSAWTVGRATLMGDAAHPAYPVGSNGAGAAIIDARAIGKALLEHGPSPSALVAYEESMRPPATQVVLTNRSAGPDRILDIVEERCQGEFDSIHAVITQQELISHSHAYKTIAGYSVEALNGAAPMIPAGARMQWAAP